MADEPTTPPQPDAAPQGGVDANAPQIASLAQYIKDLSVENPNAPKSFQFKGQPRIDLAFNIEVDKVQDDVHEVALKIEATSKSDDGTHFVIDLKYGGLFGVRNIPEEQMQPILLVELPRMLFPFARQVIAEATSQAGFAPLLLDPIDFGAVYMQRMQQMQAQAAEQGTNGNGDTPATEVGGSAAQPQPTTPTPPAGDGDDA